MCDLIPFFLGVPEALDFAAARPANDLQRAPRCDGDARVSGEASFFQLHSGPPHSQLLDFGRRAN